VPAAERSGDPIADRELPVLFFDLRNYRRLLIAVSGGPDSMALLTLLYRWRLKLGGGPKLFSATVDHRLRPASRREAASVTEYASKLKIPHGILVWQGKKPETGLQNAAREARYKLLVALAEKIDADAIVTAHTLDDQAETILMRMARGSGFSGLAGIRAKSKREGIALLRPLLGVPKSRLIATLEEAGIGYAQDSSNLDPRFTRPRLRRLASDLAAEGLDAERLAGIAGRIARADAALEAVADELQAAMAAGRKPNGSGLEFPNGTFFRVPDEIGIRLLGRAVEAAGDEGPVELGKLETLYESLKAARKAGAAVRRTLAGAVVGLDQDRVTIARAPARSRRARQAR
jgi:tRNA(Ile)-lysidine synthase